MTDQEPKTEPTDDPLKVDPITEVEPFEPAAEGSEPTPDPPKKGSPPGDDQPTADGEQHPEAAGAEVSKLKKEAANYRHKLRDAEAERDRLATRITDYDRAEVERQVTGQGGLQNAADFWLAVQLDDLRDEQGALDPAKVKAARDRILSEHPHWREPGPSFDGGAREPAPAPGPSFGEALKSGGTGR